MSKIEGREWVWSVFYTPSIFFILESYLSWQDVIALMRTCKALYHEWLSANTEKWKRARTFVKLCNALGISKPLKLNPIKAVRERAVRAMEKVLVSPYTVPCMGGCGCVLHCTRMVCKTLPYAICCVCAVAEDNYGFRVVERYLDKHGLVKGPSYPYIYNWCEKTIGSKAWKERKGAIETFWMLYQNEHIRGELGWVIPVFRKSHLEDAMRNVLDANKLWPVY